MNLQAQIAALGSALIPLLSKKINPRRRQIHINYDAQPDNFQRHHDAFERWIDTSISSTRHAAYESAARMSSCSKYGYAASISASLWPEANSPEIAPTVTRNPRMQGLPPITAGSFVMRLISGGIFESIDNRCMVFTLLMCSRWKFQMKASPYWLKRRHWVTRPFFRLSLRDFNSA